jgi:hypothetical protein
MEEEKVTVSPVNAAKYKGFLECAAAFGAHVCVLDEKEGGKKYWYVRKGATEAEHTVRPENLIDYKPLTRNQRREIWKKRQ